MGAAFARSRSRPVRRCSLLATAAPATRCTFLARPDLTHTQACAQRFGERLVQQLLTQWLLDEFHEIPAELGAPSLTWIHATAREASSRIPEWCDTLDIRVPPVRICRRYCLRLLVDIVQHPARHTGRCRGGDLPQNSTALFAYNRACQRRALRRARRAAISSGTSSSRLRWGWRGALGVSL